MKAETQRQRAEFAARLRVYSPKDPPILTRESIDELCAVFHEDAKVRRRMRDLLERAEVITNSLDGPKADELGDLLNAVLLMVEDD